MIHIHHIKTFLLIVHLLYLDRKWLRYGGLMFVMAVMDVMDMMDVIDVMDVMDVID
jgi:hypothetical protein